MKSVRIIIALLCVFAWLGISGVGGPTFGKLSEVSSNDQSTFLPASAESTRAGDWVAEFAESPQIPALIVAGFDAPLEDRQLGEFQAFVDELKAVDGVDDVVGPIPSEDREAVQFVTLVNTDDTDPDTAVEALREVLTDNVGSGALEGAQAHVAGPAGLTADLASAFAGIDGLLLIVTLSVVLVILVIVYRSILLPIIVITTSMAALCATILAIYWMARWEWIALNGQAQGIVSILVIGATTDYALLLVARHKEELLRTKSVFEAMRSAIHGSFGAIAASASTVAIALLCLLVSDLNSNRSLGPIAATGIFFAWAAANTMLPAFLYLLGRAAYWPSRPRFQGERVVEDGGHTVWHRIAEFVRQRPRKVWVTTLLLLMLGAAWLPTLQATGISTSDIILGDSDAKAGQALLNEHFDAGSGAPTSVIVPEGEAQAALDILTASEGVAEATLTAASGAPAGIPTMNEEPKVLDGRVYIQATLNDPADSEAAEATVVNLREQLHGLDDSILVGGTTATAIDSNATAERDLFVIIPLVLAVVLVILIILLRSVLLPVLLVLATIVSFGTAMGTAALVFNHLFEFPGADPSVPLYGFVFLVALGIDYTIFLMERAREETPRLGTERAVLHSLTVTGGVITSAGVVLAATFAALAVIPLMFMIQLAFIVAYGVLIDTLIVRTLLIPGLVLDIGPKIWWPFHRRMEPQEEIGELVTDEPLPVGAESRRAR